MENNFKDTVSDYTTAEGGGGREVFFIPVRIQQTGLALASEFHTSHLKKCLNP